MILFESVEISKSSVGVVDSCGVSVNFDDGSRGQ